MSARGELTRQAMPQPAIYDPALRERKADKILAILHQSWGPDLSHLRCLDIGCASGLITRALAPHVGSIIGLEYDADAVARMEVGGVSNLLLLRGDALRLPLPDASVDLVLCAQIYEHVSNAEAMVTEIERVLVPGGACFFSGPNRLDLVERHYGLPLLSWLPRPLADVYVRLAGKGNSYAERPRTYWGLKRLWRRFRRTDYTLEMIHRPQEFHCSEELGLLRQVGRLPRWLLRLFEPLYPNYNWMLFKRPVTRRTIAIDAVGIGQPGGGRSATLNLLRALLPLDTASRYLLLLDAPEPELAALGAHVEQVVIPVRHRLLARLWAQLVWPVTLRREGVQLVHHVKNLNTLGLPGRSVVTLYDMTILLHPEFYPFSDVLYWRCIQPRMLRHADRLIAISQTTARDLVRLYGLPEDAVQVIYPAYDPRFVPLPEDAVRAVRERYGTGERFILHVGSLSRKKNLDPLLSAFERLREGGYTGRLVLVGRPYGKGRDAPFFAHLAASAHREAVVLTGMAPDEDLVALYNAAELMIFPSRHEGFGIVPLEAMACGTPVITSDAGALPEVVGGGGTILANASDPEEIACAAARLLFDPAARAEAITRGLAWARRYSVLEAARQTLALYDELVAGEVKR